MNNTKKRTKTFSYFFVFILTLFCFCFFVKPVLAANIYFELEARNVLKGEIFLQKVLIDTEGEEINAVEVEIKYPKEELRVENISKGNSILKLWPKEPEAREGIINFVGGTPGGYKGKEGILVLIAFRVISKKSADFNVEISDKSKVFLNDGKGTAIEKNSFGFSKIKVFNNFSEKNEWEEFLKKDKTPPEPFEIKLSHSPYIFNNKYFISFFAIDKESGIDYYEVAEIKIAKKTHKDELIKKANWKVAKSPYLIEDQSLKSFILVKAVDKAGNEKIELLEPNSNNNLLIVGLVIVLIVAVGLIITRLKTRPKAKN